MPPNRLDRFLATTLRLFNRSGAVAASANRIADMPTLAQESSKTQPDKSAPKQIPAEAARAELRASNSRFIASAAPAATVEAARAFIAGVRAEMPDATHHVYAYIIGHGATTTLS